MSDYIIATGDTYPAPSADFNAVITGATVTFRMEHLDGRFFLNQPATIDDGPTGLAHYTWQAGNTNTEGAYLAQFHCVYAGGAIQTFPQDSKLEILIRKAVPAA